jgi:ribosomal protein S18 acetylase RimI-like enzyme
MAIMIRYAKTADLDAVLDLWWQLYKFHLDEFNSGRTCFELAPDAHEKLKSYYLEKVLPHHKVLVAEDKGKLIGYCEFEPIIRLPIFKESRGMKISGLYIIPAYRKKGVGKRLLKEVDVVRKLAQLKRVEVEAHIKNEDAISFYSSFGFKKRMMQMVRYWR